MKSFNQHVYESLEEIVPIGLLNQFNDSEDEHVQIGSIVRWHSSDCRADTTSFTIADRISEAEIASNKAAAEAGKEAPAHLKTAKLPHLLFSTEDVVSIRVDANGQLTDAASGSLVLAFKKDNQRVLDARDVYMVSNRNLTDARLKEWLKDVVKANISELSRFRRYAVITRRVFASDGDFYKGSNNTFSLTASVEAGSRIAIPMAGGQVAVKLHAEYTNGTKVSAAFPNFGNRLIGYQIREFRLTFFRKNVKVKDGHLGAQKSEGVFIPPEQADDWNFDMEVLPERVKRN